MAKDGSANAVARESRVNKKTVVIMPIANEEATILGFIRQILDLPVPDLTVVPIMDSFSKDQTQEIIEAVQKSTPNVRLLYHAQSTGVVSCYLHGFEKAIDAGADYVVEMDGGGSHDPNQIPDFIRLLDQGYDCVFSTRFKKGGGFRNHPLRRRLISRGGTWLANLALGTRLSDMTSGFEAFRAEVLEAIQRQIGFQNFLSFRATHFIQTEIRYYCAKTKFCETPIVYTGSKSTLKNKTIFNSLLLLCELRKRPPVIMA
jgi:dolichol-phosphate mannosyltransferase